MSNRLLGALALAVCLLSVAAPASAIAQGPTHTADSLLQRVRALDSVMLVRSRSVDSVRRTLVRSIPPVEVVAGPLHVRTDSTLAPRVREAATTVAELIDRRGGSVFSTRASTSVPTVTRDSTRSIVGMLPVVAINPDTARRWSRIGERQVHAFPSSGDLANGLASIVEELALQGVDSALFAWVMVGRAPLRPAGKQEMADIYVELATTESIALRQCRARIVSACLDALGIDSTSGTRLDRWYAPEDYRSMMRVVTPPREDSVAVAAWLHCRNDGDQPACVVAAHALPDGCVSLPFSASARFAFLREILDAGGPGSFDRLVNTAGALEDRLAAASREPIDRSVLRWLDHVEQARPDRMRVPATLFVASLGWSGLILGLALARRTSWA